MPKKYNYTKKTGAPTKYKPEYCQEIIDFFTYEPQVEVEIPHYKNGELAWVDKKFIANPPRFLIDFALKIGVSVESLHEWSRKHKEFSVALKKAKKLNEMTLARGAHMGVYNPTAFIFTMKNIAGWRDRQDIEHTHKVKKVKVEIVTNGKEKK